jgi:hypothetical protein
MDRFTRNYSIVPGILLLGLLFWVFYEDPQVTTLNGLLAADDEVAAYPYRFRVLRLENGVAVMGTPRSAEFPAFRALALLYPGLAAREPDDPEMMQAQLEMARVQERARAIVLDAGPVTRMIWELDTDWLGASGVPPGSY